MKKIPYINLDLFKKITKPKDDLRINASILPFRAYLIIFGLTLILTLAQAYVSIKWLGQSLSFAGILTYYLLMTGLIFTILFAINNRYVYGRPLQRIAKAARKITLGDYKVRVETNRKDGKMDEIAVLIEDFNTMAKELESVEILKSDFIANVSHEIKSPLSIIQSYAKALKDPELSPAERDQYADTVIMASQKLSDMVSNILKLSKLENQEICSLPKPYQLGEQLRRCALLYIDVWQKKGIDFEIDVDDVVINYDESLLDLVWNNIISNAVKFTDYGGKVLISTALGDGIISVVVKDFGCGMDENTKKHIFDKFYQGDASHSTEGNGLGLALVKKVVELVKGKISVESKQGEGTAVTVDLKI